MTSTMNLPCRQPIDSSYSASDSSIEGDESEAAQITVPSDRHLITSSDSTCITIISSAKDGTKSDAYSIMSSVEESEPPSPTSGPPANFDRVAPGIYRSSFPRPGNFEHLQSLGLKTILTLVSEEYPAENMQFVKENGIQHFQIPIPANKDPFVTIPPQDMARALKILTDPRSHPILIHCNKGKHRTGCVIGCYRKIHDWTYPRIVAEYRMYAAHKARRLDERFIELFDQHAAMAGMVEESSEVTSPRYMPTPPASVKDEDITTQMHRVMSKGSDASSPI